MMESVMKTDTTPINANKLDNIDFTTVIYFFCTQNNENTQKNETESRFYCEYLENIFPKSPKDWLISSKFSGG